MGCCGPNQEESFGWPKGTTRGIVALTVIPLSFIASTAVMILLIMKEQYIVAVGINSVIWGATGTIIGYYFGSKTAEAATKVITEANDKIIASKNSEIARINETNERVLQSRGFRQINLGHVTNDNDSDNDNGDELVEDELIPIKKKKKRKQGQKINHHYQNKEGDHVVVIDQ